MRYHRWILSVVLLVTVVLVGILLAQAEPRREAAGVFGVLRKGQPISLKALYQLLDDLKNYLYLAT
ncbi:MAG: hypothetical protein WCJ35_26280 [Planctomycetota bacterium]